MYDNEMFNQMADYDDLYKPDYLAEKIHQIVEQAGLTLDFSRA